MTDQEALREAARRCEAAAGEGGHRTASTEALVDLRRTFAVGAEMVKGGHTPNPTIVARARILIGEPS